MLSFDESDEKEIMDLLSVAPACLASSFEQPRMVEDARVDPSELMDSEARRDLSVAEVPEEGIDALLEPMDSEAEMSGEHPLTIEVLSKEGGCDVGASNSG